MGRPFGPCRSTTRPLSSRRRPAPRPPHGSRERRPRGLGGSECGRGRVSGGVAGAQAGPGGPAQPVGTLADDAAVRAHRAAAATEKVHRAVLQFAAELECRREAVRL